MAARIPFFEVALPLASSYRPSLNEPNELSSIVSAIEQLEHEIKLVEEIGPVEAARYAVEEYGEDLKKYLAMVWERRAWIEDYETLLAQAEAWKVPPSLREYKRYVIGYLTDVLEELERELPHPQHKTGAQWKRAEIRYLKQELRSAQKDAREERRTNEKDGEFVHKLFTSVWDVTMQEAEADLRPWQS